VPPTWRPGDRIQNRWEVYKILRGGMGIVYVVYDLEERRIYAAKTFQEEIFIRNPESAELFEREALSWIRLDSHPNVARAHAVERIEGKVFLFLDYISGGDLSTWIDTPRLTKDLPQVLRLSLQFCDGMVHARSKGIEAHRDIKPQNCLLTPDYTLKVTDFGLAKVRTVQSPEDSTAGTPAYMPPEQWGNFASADVRADIYSFGVMLFQMVTGRLPFAGRTSREFADQARHQNPPSLGSQHSHLNELVRVCLDKDPERRCPDFRDLRMRLADIYEVLTGETAPAPTLGGELTVNLLHNKAFGLANLRLFEEAIVCYDLALELDPRSAALWASKGAVLGNLNRFDEDVTCCDHALKLDPKDARSWSNKGSAKAGLGLMGEALLCYERAIQLNPRYAIPWFSKAACMNLAGKSEQSLAYANRGLELEPYSAQGWGCKASALLFLERPAEALQCFEKQQQLDPLWPEIKSMIALCRTAMRSHGASPSEASSRDNGPADVRTDASMSDDEFSNLEHQLEADQWSARGFQELERRNASEAIVCFDRCLELDAGREEVWAAKGIICTGQECHEQAIFCFDHALELNPNLGEVWSNRAGELIATKLYREAILSSDRALAIIPNLHSAWCWKGAALVAMEEFSQALACFEKAHKLGAPQASPGIAYCRERLAKKPRPRSGWLRTLFGGNRSSTGDKNYSD
jgi:tetratricopeptide (TPR) repeat protein